MDYTLDQLTSLINTLTARVNAIDGQNLPSNQVGAVPNLIKQLNSVQTDLGQLGASFENQLSLIKTQMTTIQGLINTLSAQPTA